MRFHVLGVPHTASNETFIGCAFTQKVIKLCTMLKSRGHEVLHYGNELSRIDGENVVVTLADDIGAPENFLKYNISSPLYSKFTANAIAEINKRKEANDFLLCTFGAGHRAVAEAHADMLIVESGIGYPGGTFAPFKVFESYAILHAHYGLPAIEKADKFRWYDIVIPNAFDPADFIFNAEKQDYLVFLGMRHGGKGKGIDVAIHAARDAGCVLAVAGPDGLDGKHDHVDHLGMLNVRQRAKLLAKARALIAPSIFLEPMCGAMIEAFMSGTPVISTDWGAFAEYNVHGVTGYRCRTHEQFVWAIKNAHTIEPEACRRWAFNNFTLGRIAGQYDEFFQSVMMVRTGRGWYEPNPGRTNLDGLKRLYS